MYQKDIGTLAVVTPPSPTPIAGICGTANGATTATAPSTNLCDNGTTPSGVTGTGPWNWTCSGINGSSSIANCSGNNLVVVIPPPIAVCPAITVSNGLCSGISIPASYFAGEIKTITGNISASNGS